ncbi:hypothetical protein [Coprobacter secundus]|uniref:hypothetical protein n=1 Tax=Coprobacter secundus TaxID=1501392 RepID=UPI00033CAE05|nr:hypothetical protein [Coprobacter secundus]CCY37652.1 unknown [Tannerella sp. CAG:118]
MAQDLDRYAGQINVGVDCIHANIDKCLDVHSLAQLTSFFYFSFPPDIFCGEGQAFCEVCHAEAAGAC